MTNHVLMETSYLFTCRHLLSVMLESAQSQFVHSVGLIKVVNREKGMIYDAYVLYFRNGTVKHCSLIVFVQYINR